MRDLTRARSALRGVVSSSRHVSAENRGFLDETVVYIQEHCKYVVSYASGHIHSCSQVTYRLLSRELGIHVNVAKKCVLFSFLSFFRFNTQRV